MNYKKYILKNKWAFLSVVFLQIIMWGCQVLVQLFAINAFDGAIKLNFNLFIKWTFISFITWGIYFLICSFEAYKRADAIRIFNNDVRNDIYLSFYNDKISNIYKSDKSDYISYVTHNISEITRLCWEPLFNMLGRIAQILWSIIALVYIDIYLFIFAIITTLIMWYMPKIFEDKFEKLGTENLQAQSIAMGKFKDLLYGISILKILNRKNWYVSKGAEASNISEDAKFRQNYIVEILECIMGYISIFLQVLSEVLVVVLAVYGRIGVAVIAGAANLIGGVSNGINNFVNAKNSIVQSRSYFEIIKDNNIKERELSFKDKIELKNISYSYDEKEVLNNINMEFKKNHKYAIVGKSGSGKSTILKIIMGIIDDYEGDVLYDGVAKEKDAIDYNIGYVSQDIYLFNDTIRENLTLGKSFSNNEIKDALTKSSLQKFLEFQANGLDTIVGDNGKSISGGEKQRIAVARSLLQGCDMLLIDEGTSALDKENREIIENNLLNDKNLTLIMVSHHLNDDMIKKFDKVYEI